MIPVHAFLAISQNQLPHTVLSPPGRKMSVEVSGMMNPSTTKLSTWTMQKGTNPDQLSDFQSSFHSFSFFSHLADKFLREGKSKSGCNCGRGLFFLVMWMNIRITRYTSQFYSHNINPLVFLEPDCCLLARALECKVATFFLLHKVKMFSQIFPRQFFFRICQICQLPPWFPHQVFSKTIVKT